MAQSDLDMESIATHVPDDREVTERVRAKLSVVLSDVQFEVKARAGVVTLTGQIRDSAQSRAASLITHRVEGVTNVVNKLTVGRGLLALAYPPRAGAAVRAKGTALRKIRRQVDEGDQQAAAPGAA